MEHVSNILAHGSGFTVRCSRFEVRGSVFKVQFCSRFPVAAFTNRRQASRNLAAQQLLTSKSRRQGIMSLVRLLGYTTLACGCVVGRYREVASSRELAYVEEKGSGCG